MTPAGRPLRFRLFLLAASGLLPLAVVAIAAFAYAMGDRARDAERAALDISRALGTAVDAELNATTSVLQSLALADELQEPRLDAFQSLANRIAQAQGWRAILLADASGRTVMSSATPPGATPPATVDPASLQQAVRTRSPVVGRVLPGRSQPGPAFAVRVPVTRAQADFVLSAVIPAERIRAVLTRQNFPDSSVVAVFDQSGSTVTRSRPGSSNRPSPSLQALLANGSPEGHGPTVTLEGVRSFTGFTRLKGSGWVVATGISVDEASRGLYGVLGWIAAGLVASLALSAFLARFFARDVIEPIDSLKAAAGALGRGEPVQLPPLAIAELRDVGAALRLASDERDRAARERRAAEAEREQLLARATEALGRAEEAGRSKDEFLAMLGHELRNPLAPMATALHLMARKGDERTRSEREVMERQVAHMKRLVDDLLDVSRITSKRLAMRFEPIRLADVVRQAAAIVQPVLGLRRFRLQLPPEAGELWVSGDEVRLGQVLNNLLGNAIKFTGPHAAITLGLRQQGDEAEIRVEDDGLGMPPEVLAHVFELFYQAPQGADRSLGGLGLGLPIVRSLVEMHGGSVQAHSEGAGRGSTLVVRLPLIAAPQRGDAGEPVLPDGTQGARVLVVDDNQDAAQTAAALLELSGYDVRMAFDPGVALALLDDFAPDVALLDIGLPGMSGYELATKLRGHPHGQSTWLVALTGYGTQADVLRAQQAGFDRHLVKPAAPDAMLAAVEAGVQRE